MVCNKIGNGSQIFFEEETQGIDIAEFGHSAYTIGHGEFVTHDEIELGRGSFTPKTENLSTT